MTINVEKKIMLSSFVTRCRMCAKGPIKTDYRNIFFIHNNRLWRHFVLFFPWIALQTTPKHAHREMENSRSYIRIRFLFLIFLFPAKFNVVVDVTRATYLFSSRIRVHDVIWEREMFYVHTRHIYLYMIKKLSGFNCYEEIKFCPKCIC